MDYILGFISVGTFIAFIFAIGEYYKAKTQKLLKAQRKAKRKMENLECFPIQSASKCFFAGQFGEVNDDAWVVYRDMVANGYPVATIKQDVNDWQGLTVEWIVGNLNDVEKMDIATIVTQIAHKQQIDKNES